MAKVACYLKLNGFFTDEKSNSTFVKRDTNQPYIEHHGRLVDGKEIRFPVSSEFGIAVFALMPLR